MRLRILRVAPYGEAAWAYGGIPRVVGALTRGLALRGHAVTVCTTDAFDQRMRLPVSRGRTEDDNREGVSQHVFPNLSNRLAYHQQGFFPIGFRDYLRRHVVDFDVAHLH